MLKRVNILALVATTLIINTFADYTIQNGKFYINGVITNKGRKSEGTLMNVRAIQAIFDDTLSVKNHLYPDTKKWDPMRQTREFVSNMTNWKSYGLNAFTVGMMGGITHYPHNCAGWNPNGSLKQPYLTRLKLILDEVDRIGMIPIVSFFHQLNVRQFSSTSVVQTAVTNFANWLQPYKNKIIVEITNECNINKPSLPAMKVDCPNIIKYFQQLRNMGFKVGNSIVGSPPSTLMLQNMDIIFLHGNDNSLSSVMTKVRRTKQASGYTGQPIIFNEGINDPVIVNALAGMNPPIGSGLYLLGKMDYKTGFQTPPTNWRVTSDPEKIKFFNAVKAL